MNQAWVVTVTLIESRSSISGFEMRALISAWKKSSRPVDAFKQERTGKENYDTLAALAV